MKARKQSLLPVVVTVIGLSLLMVVLPTNCTFAQGLTPHQEAINEAIERGLAWLQANQNPDGSWDAYGGFRVAGAGFGAIAFLGQGYDETDSTVAAAINYLLSRQQPDGSIHSGMGWDINYETSCAVMALAATGDSAYDGVIAGAVGWLINDQWDEFPPNQCDPSHDYWGGFGYQWNDRPDLSNSQFSIVALAAAKLDPANPAWGKAITFIQRCQGTENGFVYLPGGGSSYGSMTAAGVWALRLCGVPVSDPYVQGGLEWFESHYAYDNNPGAGWMHYYYLWSAAKAFLICDIKDEIGGLIPVDPEDTLAFYPGWYHDFSKYLVSVQDPAGYWNREEIWTDTYWALLVLGKEVAIPYAVLVSIFPTSVSVNPGETADFTVTVENIGTEQDSYDMDILDLPADFTWEMEDPVMNVPGGDTVQLPLGITPPSDLAIWVDTPFPFKVEATSLTDSLISHATTAVVVITAQATPISRVRFTDELLDSLIAQVEGADIHNGVKNSLLSKLYNAERKKHQGLARLEAGDTTVALNMFNAAANMLGAFINEVEAQRGKKITEEDADSFIACAEDIIWRLQTGIWEGGSPPPAKMAGEDIQSPQRFELSQNIPNPFNPVTQISYTLPRDGHVKLEIYNLLGQKVATLVDEYQQAGQKTVNWEAKDFASGIYFYKLSSGDFTATKKMVLTK